MGNGLKLYKCKGILWSYEYYEVKPHCPIDKCELNVEYNDMETDFSCPQCDFTVSMKKDYPYLRDDIEKIICADSFKDAEIVNIDGESIKIAKEEGKDSDYWLEASISKNSKGVKQVMVLAGSRKNEDKTQLFLDIDNEKLSFDQNNDHPKKLLAKVTATFKDTTSTISEK